MACRLMQYRFIVLTLVLFSCSAIPIDCPVEWDEFRFNCYHFVFYPKRDVTAASALCQLNGASLLSIDNGDEHQFVASWLDRHDINRINIWLTSGVGNSSTLTWRGDGHVGYRGHQPWADDLAANKYDDAIVYKYSLQNNSFLWDRAGRTTTLSYICEIPKVEAFRIGRPARDYSYGTNNANPSLLPRGPKFTIVPKNVIITGRLTSTYLECAASGYPLPVYKWYKLNNDGSSSAQLLTSQMDKRYTLTNGKLTISNVSSKLDPGDYQCTAQNPSGSIVSETVHISHGYLNEFSNDPRGHVTARLYQGTVINCLPPVYNPAVTYQWYKGSAQHFVRPQLNAYQFISGNGKLYLSETQRLDAGVYFCVVTLAAPSGRNWRLATTQPPSRTSLGIELRVEGEAASDFGPNIHDDFPAVFPNPTLRGQTLRLECLAYGRSKMYYSWSRDGGLPANSLLSYHSRVLTIENVQIRDSGSYSCTVRRSGAPVATKSVSVSVQAAPYFVIPLQNQFIDIGSDLIWRCQATAIPPPVYTWLKNSRPLFPVPGKVEIKGNVLTIFQASPSVHGGMYQCSAFNIHGKSFSSAELRVLSFKPTFIKNKVKDSLATVDGNATFFCRPEAAPVPELTWYKDGVEITLRPGDESQGRLQFLRNGNLHLLQVTLGDAGIYRCTAKNSEGTAYSEGRLFISERTTLSVQPTDTDVVVNETAFFMCEASFNPDSDLVYVWRFNDHVISTHNDPHYVQGVHDGQMGLYIRLAQYKHAGMYTCTALTVRDRTSQSATLTVRGSPGEPGGVFGKITRNDVTLHWHDGTNHNSPITYYVIEYSTNFNHEWRVVVQNLPVEQTLDSVEESRRQTQVVGLRPGTSYRFRVRAANVYGLGEPSLTSIYYRTPDAPPAVAPISVGGGGGKVGTLKLAWQVLSREDEGGVGIGYRVYWRLKGNENGLWSKEDKLGHVGEHVATIGTDMYYLEYEVKVAAFNDLGIGPNSSVAVIYSAEDLPYGAPHNIQAATYNATGISVSWDPVPDDRQVMKGKIRGSLVTWWFWESANTKRYKSYHYGSNNTVIVIGLPANGVFWVKVQVFNGAGLGPETQPYYVETAGEGPLHYPEYVNIRSHGPHSVYVSWRGVSTGLQEEAVVGYKLRYWKTDEDLYQARDVTIDDKRTHGVIDGLEKGYVYTLRMVGYGLGGVGKKAPPVYFTLGGMIHYNKLTTEVMATGLRQTAGWTSVLLCATCSFLYPLSQN